MMLSHFSSEVSLLYLAFFEPSFLHTLSHCLQWSTDSDRKRYCLPSVSSLARWLAVTLGSCLSTVNTCLRCHSTKKPMSHLDLQFLVPEIRRIHWPTWWKSSRKILGCLVLFVFFFLFYFRVSGAKFVKAEPKADRLNEEAFNEGQG